MRALSVYKWTNESWMSDIHTDHAHVVIENRLTSRGISRGVNTQPNIADVGYRDGKLNTVGDGVIAP